MVKNSTPSHKEKKYIEYIDKLTYTRLLNQSEILTLSSNNKYVHTIVKVPAKSKLDSMKHTRLNNCFRNYI